MIWVINDFSDNADTLYDAKETYLCCIKMLYLNLEELFGGKKLWS